MRGLIIILRCLACFFTILVMCTALTVAAQDQESGASGHPDLRSNAEGNIVIGGTVPITGPLATSGLLYYDALHMAEEDINAAGGIHGIPVDIIFEDTQQSNSTAVSAFIKLVQDHDPVAVFLSSYTPQNFAVEPEVTRAAVPSFYAGGADGLHQRGNPWMFRIKQPDSVIVDAMVDTVINRLGKRRPAILYIQNDYGQGLAKDAEGRFKAIGVDPILESYQASDNDLTPQLLSAVGQGADILLSVGFMGLGPVHTVTLAEARDKAARGFGSSSLDRCGPHRGQASPETGPGPGSCISHGVQGLCRKVHRRP